MLHIGILVFSHSGKMILQRYEAPYNADMQFLGAGNIISLEAQLDKRARHNRQLSYQTKERYYIALKRLLCGSAAV